MKVIILIMLISVVTATCWKPVRAEVEVSVKHFSDNSGGDYFKLTSWRGIEVKYQHGDGLYYFLSEEEARTYFAAPSFKMNFTGFGVGFKKPVTNSINVYGQIGYYITDTEARGRFSCEQAKCDHWESLHYALNHKWGSTHNGHTVIFNEYEVDSTDAYGITIGAELLHPITDNLSLNFGVEWRAMSYTLLVHGMAEPWNYDETGARWETTFKGTDSTNFKVGLNYRF